MWGESAKVFSYLRFSDPKQATGHSAERQAEYARTWASERGLLLDESLSLRDEGLSAFHQKHVKQGALGVFLQAVADGRIPVGSVLVVEGLDRLSRAEPLQAQAQLGQIINAGITVVTASDGREYNRDKLKAQPMDLVYSLLVMIRAHEESDTKSKRVKASIRRMCEGWINGSFRGVIRNGSDPRWLHLEDGVWKLIPDRVEATLFAVEKYKEGCGADRTFSLMRVKGYDTDFLGVSPQQLYRSIKLVALKGAKQLSIDGQSYLLDDYYPRLMSDADFDELQALTAQRSRRRGKGAIPGVVTGIGMTWCGYCGTAMTAQNVMQKAKPDGTLSDGFRRIVCLSYMNSDGCTEGGSCSVAPVERAVMSYCADQFNLSRLLEPAKDGRDQRGELVRFKLKVEDIERQLGRVTEALALGEGDGALPIAFLRKARELEAALDQARGEVQQAERELHTASSWQRSADASIWAQLAEGVEAQIVEVRDRVRQLMLDTFKRIVIYMRGVVPEGRKSPHIDVLLISNSGQRRWLRVERKTGKWTATSDRPG